MKKEEKFPSFDELKNPDYTYYYSRNERLARKRKEIVVDDKEKKRSKGILGYISGGNSQVKSFIGFYIFIALIFWIFTYMIKIPNLADKNIIKISDNRTLKISAVKSERLNGLNLVIDNKGNEDWNITNIKITEKSLIFSTNLNLRVEKNNFEAIFIELTNSLDIKKIKVDLN